MSRTHCRRLALAMAAAVAVPLFVAVAAPVHAAVQVVTKAAVPYAHFTTIQAAVNAAAPGGWPSSNASASAIRRG